MSIRRGVIQFIKATFRMKEAQVSGKRNELINDVELMQHYGFSSVHTPKDDDGRGAECAIAFANDSNEVPIIIADEDRRYRPTTQNEGEVCLYTYKDDRTASNDEADHRLSLYESGSDLVIKLRANGTTETEISQTSAGTVLIKVNDTTITLTDGDITLDTDGTINNTATSNITINSSANVTVEASTSITLDAPTLNIDCDTINATGTNLSLSGTTITATAGTIDFN